MGEAASATKRAASQSGRLLLNLISIAARFDLDANARRLAGPGVELHPYPALVLSIQVTMMTAMAAMAAMAGHAAAWVQP